MQLGIHPIHTDSRQLGWHTPHIYRGRKLGIHPDPIHKGSRQLGVHPTHTGSGQLGILPTHTGNRQLGFHPTHTEEGSYPRYTPHLYRHAVCS